MYLMKNYDEGRIVNVGCGEDISIKDLTHMIADIAGFKGKIIFDETKPDGTPKKLLDSSYIADLGWKAKISLEEGIKRTYSWYLETQDKGAG